MSAAEMTPEQAAAMEAQMRYTLGVLMDLDILIALTSNLLYGVYIVAFGMAMSILVRRGLDNKGRKILFGTLLFLFITTTGYFTSMIGFLLVFVRTALKEGTDQPISARFPPSAKAIANPNIASLICQALNFFPGDALIVWRVWVLFERSRWVPCVLMVILLGSLGTSIWVLTERITTILSGAPTLVHSYESAYLFLSLGVNCISTLCVGWKTLKHHNYLKSSHHGSSPGTVTKILTALVECGLSFCAVQLANSIVAVIGTGEYDSTANYTSAVITPICMIYAGMYPCILVILLLSQGAYTDIGTSAGSRAPASAPYFGSTSGIPMSKMAFSRNGELSTTGTGTVVEISKTENISYDTDAKYSNKV